MLIFLDYLLSFVHLALMAFNLFGWIWPRTRRIHLITAGITLASWFILGIWFGIGYCPITDWQWQVKEKLGERNLPASFVKYSADRITGKNFDPDFINVITLVLFFLAIGISVYLSFFKRNRFKRTYTP